MPEKSYLSANGIEKWGHMEAFVLRDGDVLLPKRIECFFSRTRVAAKGHPSFAPPTADKKGL